MKKIIDRKLYDTETATEIAEVSNGLSCSDFNHCTETLYKTKRGAFFLHGVGGAFSRYSESLGNNSRGGGENIIPYSKEEVIDWLEENDLVSTLMEHFPDIIEEA